MTTKQCGEEHIKSIQDQFEPGPLAIQNAYQGAIVPNTKFFWLSHADQYGINAYPDPSPGRSIADAAAECALWAPNNCGLVKIRSGGDRPAAPDITCTEEINRMWPRINDLKRQLEETNVAFVAKDAEQVDILERLQADMDQHDAALTERLSDIADRKLPEITAKLKELDELKESSRTWSSGLNASESAIADLRSDLGALVSTLETAHDAWQEILDDLQEKLPVLLGKSRTAHRLLGELRGIDVPNLLNRLQLLLDQANANAERIRFRQRIIQLGSEGMQLKNDLQVSYFSQVITDISTAYGSILSQRDTLTENRRVSVEHLANLNLRDGKAEELEGTRAGLEDDLEQLEDDRAELAGDWAAMKRDWEELQREWLTTQEDLRQLQATFGTFTDRRENLVTEETRIMAHLDPAHEFSRLLAGLHLFYYGNKFRIEDLFGSLTCRDIYHLELLRAHMATGAHVTLAGLMQIFEGVPKSSNPMVNKALTMDQILQYLSSALEGSLPPWPFNPSPSLAQMSKYTSDLQGALATIEKLRTDQKAVIFQDQSQSQTQGQGPGGQSTGQTGEQEKLSEELGTFEEDTLPEWTEEYDERD
ncbi:hypothetical protein HY464_00010, partial [Candidatus Peregrinibacteria bacterium]|nr:hypothetical protein [Candidatus Peregrinibacteria bacterium]